jgi:hypothetical protein
MSRVLNAVLAHTPPGEIARSVAWWSHVTPAESLLVVHGGPMAEFGAIEFANKVHISAERLRTVDHPRERQSYTEVFAAISEWMRGRDFSHVYFAEFDHLPLVSDLNQRLLARLAAERADMLCHGLLRVDDTGWHHYLYHCQDPRFHEYWESMSRRENRRVVLWILGTGTFWTREAFDAVAGEKEPFPMYHEIYIPTLAHHLGYRVRAFHESEHMVSNLGDFHDRIARARSNGLWTIHPVKSLAGLKWPEPQDGARA